MEHLNFIGVYTLEITLLSSLEPPVAYQKVGNAMLMAQKWATDHQLIMAIWPREAKGAYGHDDYIVQIPVVLENLTAVSQPPGLINLDAHVKLIRVEFKQEPDPTTLIVMMANIRARDRLIESLTMQADEMERILEAEDA